MVLVTQKQNRKKKQNRRKRKKAKKIRDDSTYLIFLLKNTCYNVEDVDAQPRPRLIPIC